MPHFNGFKQQPSFALLTTSAVAAVFSAAAHLCSCGTNGGHSAEAGGSTGKMAHSHGELVLAVGWELSWGYQPASSFPSQAGLSVGVLGLPHSMAVGS